MLPALSRCISQLNLTGVRGFVRASHSLTLSNDKRLAQWNRAISNAEKIVGSPNSNFTLKLLMSDNGIGAGSHIRKLLNTSHPVIKTIKKLIYNGKNNLQTRGLVILLLSRCAGHIEGSPQMLLGEWEEASVDGITERQRNLSEIVEMVYTSHLIHRDVMNVSRELITDESLLNDLQYGNKIAILVGDILIANASKKTSELNNCKVLELIANAIGNFMKSEFVIRHDSFGKPFPAASMTSAIWEDRIILNSGALLSSACQSAVLMGGHGDSAQRKANEFGKCLGLVWQLHEELEPFSNLIYQAPGAPFDLTSLPCVLFLERNPHLLQSLETSIQNINHIDYADLFSQILASGCVEEANLRLNSYVHMCLTNLDTFDSCYKAKQALVDIIEAMKHV